LQVHFVTPPLSEAGLTDVALGALTLGSLPSAAAEVMSRHGKWVWSLRTHLELKEAGYGSTAGAALVPGAINVGHRDALRVLMRSSRLLPRSTAVVVCQADKPRLWGVDYRIQQCGERRGALVPHWPERGLLTRDETRRNRVENVAFFGLPPEREAPIHRRFEEILAARGLTYQINGSSAMWKDYSEVDVSVALRSEWRAKGKWKPASKLQNARVCRVHFVATPEPSYRVIDPACSTWTPARTVGEAVAAIDGLREDPAWFDRLRSCLDGVTEHSLTREAVAAWIRVLDEIKADHGRRAVPRNYLMRIGYRAGLGHLQRAVDLGDNRLRGRSARQVAAEMVDV
jgi:hypothetical protein